MASDTTKHSSSEEPSKGNEKAAELNVELGVGQIFPGALWDDWTYADRTTLSNKPVVTLEQLTDMRRHDGQVQALHKLVTLPLLASLKAGEWIEPDEGGAEAEVEFANQMWNLSPMAGGMTSPKNKIIRQMVLSVVDGFAAFEIVRHVPDSGPLKGKITLRKLAYRDPRTIKFNIDRQGGYAGFRQTTYNGKQELVDITLEPLKTLTLTNSGEFNPYYGVSFFESAYPHFDAKKKLYYIAHLAAQFAAVPGRIGILPPGARPSDVAMFREGLKNFAFNTAMVAPPEYKVEPFNGNSSFDFMKLIEHHNTQMSKSVLAPFFDQDQRPVLIENTTQDASADLFLSCMESIAEDIAGDLSMYLMPQFIDFNFTSKKYPVFRPGKLSDSAKSLIRELFGTLAVSGIVNTTPEFVRELEKKMTGQMDLDIDYDEIEKKEQQAAEEAQQMEQQQADMEAQAAAQGVPPAGGGTGGGFPPKPAGGAPAAAKGNPLANPAVKRPGASVKLSADEIVENVEDISEEVDRLILAANALFDLKYDDIAETEVEIDE